MTIQLRCHGSPVESYPYDGCHCYGGSLNQVPREELRVRPRSCNLLPERCSPQENLQLRAQKVEQTKVAPDSPGFSRPGTETSLGVEGLGVLSVSGFLLFWVLGRHQRTEPECGRFWNVARWAEVERRMWGLGPYYRGLKDYPYYFGGS